MIPPDDVAPCRAARPVDGPQLFVQAVTGPDCSAPMALLAGRHVIGRAPTACLRFDDPAMELHHAVVDVASNGSAIVHQLSGRSPILIEGQPCSTPAMLSADRTLRLGTTDLLVGPSTKVPACVSLGDGAATAALSRAADHRAQAAGVVATSGVAGVAVLVTGVAMLIAGVAARLADRPTLAAATITIGGIGAVAAAVVGRVRRIRTARRVAVDATVEVHASLRSATAAARQAHLHRHPSLADVLRNFESGDSAGAAGAGGAGDSKGPDRTAIDVTAIGQPVDNDRSSPEVSLGVGDAPWNSPVNAPAMQEATTLDNVAITWSPQPGTVTTIVGDRPSRLALARAVVIQLAIGRGPLAWNITVETTTRQDWDWMQWLPASQPSSQASSQATLIVFDNPNVVEQHVVEMATLRNVTAIVLVADDGAMRLDQVATLKIGSTGMARWADDEFVSAFKVSGLGVERASNVARRLTRRVGPEPQPALQSVEESPSNHRGPAPNRAAESSTL